MVGDAGQPQVGEQPRAEHEDHRQQQQGGTASTVDDANRVLTVCWTSGTTGTPKGVPRSHNMWVATGQYSARAGNVLQIETRGYEQTTPARHEAGQAVTLVSDDAIKNAIENLGDLRFLAVATPTDFREDARS